MVGQHNNKKQNKINMKFILFILSILMCGSVFAQDIKYSIGVPSGVRGSAQHLPTSIDTNHYYSDREIRELAQPKDGWTSFYRGMDSLTYPQEAKKRKLQSAMKVTFKVNEYGVLDTVYIHSLESYSISQKCTSCEALIVDYFKNTTWTAGKVRDTAVKTIDFMLIEFKIYDPNGSVPTMNPFGF